MIYMRVVDYRGRWASCAAIASRRRRHRRLLAKLSVMTKTNAQLSYSRRCQVINRGMRCNKTIKDEQMRSFKNKLREEMQFEMEQRSHCGSQIFLLQKNEAPLNVNHMSF